MPITVLVALIGAGSAALGAALVFLAKARFEHPIAQQQADVSASALVLSQVTYLHALIPALEAQVASQAAELTRNREECEGQIARTRAAAEAAVASVRAEAAQTLAAKDHDIDALQTLTTKLLLRLNKLDPDGAHDGQP